MRKEKFFLIIMTFILIFSFVCPVKASVAVPGSAVVGINEVLELIGISAGLNTSSSSGSSGSFMNTIVNSNHAAIAEKYLNGEISDSDLDMYCFVNGVSKEYVLNLFNSSSATSDNVFTWVSNGNVVNGYFGSGSSGNNNNNNKFDEDFSNKVNSGIFMGIEYFKDLFYGLEGDLTNSINSGSGIYSSGGSSYNDLYSLLSDLNLPSLTSLKLKSGMSIKQIGTPTDLRDYLTSDYFCYLYSQGEGNGNYSYSLAFVSYSGNNIVVSDGVAQVPSDYFFTYKVTPYASDKYSGYWFSSTWGSGHSETKTIGFTNSCTILWTNKNLIYPDGSKYIDSDSNSKPVLTIGDDVYELQENNMLNNQNYLQELLDYLRANNMTIIYTNPTTGEGQEGVLLPDLDTLKGLLSSPEVQTDFTNGSQVFVKPTEDIQIISNPDITFNPSESPDTDPDYNNKPNLDVEAEPTTQGFFKGFWNNLINVANWFGEKFIGKSNTKIDTNDLKTNTKQLITRFPFCIPFDMVNTLKMLFVPGECPVISIDLSPAFDNFKNDGLNLSGLKIEIDFSDSRFLGVFKLIKFFIYIIFCVGLMRVTRNLIRG